MSNLPRIVILGLPKSGKKTLFQGLGRYFDFDHRKQPEREEKVGERLVRFYEAEVFTKYYKAKMELCFVNGNNSELTPEELNTIINEDCQGVIFVCRSVDTSSLDIIKKWDDAILPKKDAMELRLVVSSFNDIQNSISTNNLKVMKDWCIDSLYELIPANLRIPHYSWNSTEKEGVARVVEDMECIMWSNIDMNQRRTTERVIEETPIMNEEEMNRCGCCHKSRSADHVTLYLCSRCRTISYCSRDCQVKDWKNHKSFCNQVSGIDPTAKAKEEEKKRMEAVETSMASALPSPPQSKEDIEMENFAKLLQECRATKLQAKDLPDAERKRRAAIMAAKLMKEFGLSDNNEAEQILEDCKADL